MPVRGLGSCTIADWNQQAKCPIWQLLFGKSKKYQCMPTRGERKEFPHAHFLAFSISFPNSPAACRQSAYASAVIRIAWAAVVVVVAWLNLGLSRELRCGVWGMLERVKDRARVIDGRLIGMPTLSNALQL
jgi:hypothetical protein